MTAAKDRPDLAPGVIEARRELPALATVVAGGLVVLAVVQPFVVAPQHAVLTTASAATAALAVGVVSVVAGRSDLGEGTLAACAVLVGLAPLAQVPVHLATTGDPRLAGFLAAGLVLAAALLPSRRAWATAAALAALAWVVAVLQADVADEVLRGIPLALLASGLAGGALLQWRGWLTRRRTADEVAALIEELPRDPRSGALTAPGLELAAAPLLARARRSGDAVHAVEVEVAGLGSVADRLGSPAGDRLLATVVDALRASVRSTDVVARVDADRFVVVGPGAGAAPLDLELRVVDLLATRPLGPAAAWTGPVTTGAAMITPWDDGGLDELLAGAEQARRRRAALRSAAGPSA